MCAFCAQKDDAYAQKLTTNDYSRPCYQLELPRDARGLRSVLFFLSVPFLLFILQAFLSLVNRGS